MALSTQQQLDALAKDLNESISLQRLELGAVVKADINAAIAAIDAYFDTNAAAINSAIPQPARGVLTTQQKALLVVKVIRMRYGV